MGKFGAAKKAPAAAKRNARAVKNQVAYLGKKEALKRVTVRPAKRGAKKVGQALAGSGTKTVTMNSSAPMREGARKKAASAFEKARTVTTSTSKPVRQKGKKAGTSMTKTTTRKLGSGKKTTKKVTTRSPKGMSKALPKDFMTVETTNKKRSWKPALKSSKTATASKSTKNLRLVTKTKVTRPLSARNAAVGGTAGAGYITYKRKTKSGKTITVRRKR
jgi:hypothetical protein